MIPENHPQFTADRNAAQEETCQASACTGSFIVIAADFKASAALASPVIGENLALQVMAAAGVPLWE